MQKSALTAIIVLQIFAVAAFSLIALDRSSFYLEHLENFEPTKLIILFLAVIASVAAYGFLLHEAEKASNIPSIITKISWFTCLIYAVLPPALSRDAATYLIAARNHVEFGLSPFAHPLKEVELNSWLNEVGPLWILDFGSFYGPLFLAVTVPFAALSTSLTASIILYKLSLCFFLWLTVSQLSNKRSPVSVLLLLSNPAVLVSGILEGHNDIYALTGVVIALLNLRSSPLITGAAIASATAIKYHMLLIWPVTLVASDKRDLRLPALTLLFIVIFFLLGFLLFDFSASTFISQTETLGALDCFYSCGPIVRLSDYILGPSEFWLTRSLGAIFFVVILSGLFLRKCSPDLFAILALGILFFFEIRWLTPWYFLPLIGALICVREKVSARRFVDAALLVTTAYSLLRYFAV